MLLFQGHYDELRSVELLPFITIAAPWNNDIYSKSIMIWQQEVPCDLVLCEWSPAGNIEIKEIVSNFAPSQRETALLCNDVSHWLGAT